MKKLVLFFLSVLLLTLALPAAAQNDQTIELGDGYVISVPEDWEEVEDDELDGLVLEGRIGRDVYSMQVLTPAEVADLVDVDNDIEDVFVDLLNELYEVEAENIEELDLTYPTLFWSYEVEESGETGGSYFIEFDDETFGFVDIYGDDFEDVRETADEIIASFDSTGENESEETASATCFVSVDTRDTARLRVGPGENRTSVAFLAVDEDFQVEGRIVLDDDSVWFKLNKDEAAPGRAVNEIWVAEADVETDGDCENIADASAPPVIPVTPRTTGGDNNGGGNDDNAGGNDDSGTETEVGQVPNNGRWTLTLDGTTNASCTGSANISFPTTDIYFQTVYTNSLTVAADQRSFAWADGVYNILQPGSYNGSFDFGGGNNAQMRVDVQNPNFMTGWLTLNLTVQGVGCSATTTFTMSRG